MKKMEKDYAELRKKEQEEMVELRVRKLLQYFPRTFAKTPNSVLQRLRNENRLLKKRNELLEAESTELANRLVRGQVSRAEEEETKSVFQSMHERIALIRNLCSFAIQSELLALRRAHLEISHQLETSNEEIRALSLRLQENVSGEGGNLRLSQCQ